MIFPFLAGLFGGLGAAGTAAAAAPVAAGAAGAGTAAGIGAGLGAAGAGAAGAAGAGALPSLLASGAIPGAAGAAGAGATGAGLAAAAPGALGTAAELGTLAGSSIPAAAPGAAALPAATGPLAGGAGTEAAKIAARLPSMIPPSSIPTPLASTAVPTQALTEGAGFAGTMVPEIGAPSAGLTAPTPSPAQMFGAGPGGAPAPMTAPIGPNANLQILEPAFAEPGMGPVQQAAMDLTRSTQFPGGPLPTAPEGVGAGRFDMAFGPTSGFPEPGLMPADATVTMAQAAPPGPIDVASAAPPLSPVDIPGSGLPQQPPMAEVPSVSGPTEDTLAFADSGAGIEPPAPFEAPPAEPAAADESGGIFGGYGKFVVPGALAASALLPTGEGGIPEDDKEDSEDADIPEYQVAFPGTDYVPGVDPEFRYFTPTFADGGMINVPFDINVGEPSVELGMSQPSTPAPAPGGIGAAMPHPPNGMPGTQTPPQLFQEGGMVDDPRMDVMMGAVDAMRGNHPNPQEAINAFIEMFGEAAFRDLQQRMANEPRMVEGPGGPKDDMIPAVINDVQAARLSDGEFVMPADAVAAMGGGDTELGARQLQMMSEQLRGQAPTGGLNVDRVAS